jgi:hypothetical protein
VTGVGATIGRRPEGAPETEAGSTGAGRADDRYERAFVYGILVASALAAVAFVARYGRDVPFWDEWDFVPELVGDRQAGLGSLWAFHNEHRLPLALLVMLATWRFDLGHRFVMFATVGVLAALAVALVAAARKIRGRSSYTDAALAVLVLQWGHYENLIFAMQFFFVAATALACGVVVLVARDDWRGRAGQVAALAVMLVLLPLNGAMGVAYAVALVGWAIVAAVDRWRASDAVARRDAVLLAGGAAAASVVVALYFVGFERKTWHPESPSLAASVSTSLEVLGTAIGPKARDVWPWAGAGVAGLAAFAGLHAIAASYVASRERLRALGLLLGLAAFVGLTVMIGHARASLAAGAGSSARYMILTAPIVCIAYLAILAYAPPRRRAFVCACVATAVAVLLISNYQEGRVYGEQRAMRADALAADAKRGLPSAALAMRHGEHFYPDGHTLADRLESLRRSRRSVFAGVTTGVEDCRRETTIEPIVLETHDMSWSGRAGDASGADPFVVLDLGPARHVCAVVVTFTADRGGQSASALTAYWMQAGVSDFSQSERVETLPIRADATEQQVTFWINGVVDRLRLDPDAAPTRFELRRISVLEQ